MDAIKIFLLFFIFIPLFAVGQETKYPKDTIYVKYENKTGNKKILNWNYKGKNGIYFSIKEKSGKHISLFYPEKAAIDTLCILHLKEYKFLNLKEIREKEIDWVDRKFKDQKYKPYSGSKNAVFQTYLIEVISGSYFVIYPVIWRNEGVID